MEPQPEPEPRFQQQAYPYASSYASNSFVQPQPEQQAQPYQPYQPQLVGMLTKRGASFPWSWKRRAFHYDAARFEFELASPNP